MRGLDLQDRISDPVDLYVAVHEPSEDLVVMEMVIPALLFGNGFLHAYLLAFKEPEAFLQNGRPGREIVPQDRFQDVPGIDVLVGLVPGI